MELYNAFLRKNNMQSSSLISKTGALYTHENFQTECENFKNYIDQTMEFYDDKTKNKLDDRIFYGFGKRKKLKGFYSKFEKAFDKWKEDLETYGKICFHIGRVFNALYIGLWDFDYVNDPNGSLSPVGPYLFNLLEVHRHRRIGIFHALEQQQFHPNSKNLVNAQLLSNEIFKTFFLDDSKLIYWPVIQFSAGGPAAFFSNPYTPTIITLDKSKTENCEDFSALPHECGHAIAGSILGRELLKNIELKLKNYCNSKKNSTLFFNYWKWWIEECFADAIGVAVMGEAEIVSLAYLFKNLDIDDIPRHHSYLRVNEHPNRFIRVLVTIEVGKLLGLNKKVLDIHKNEWEKLAKKKNRSRDLKSFKDRYNKKRIKRSDFEEGIKFISEAIVETTYTVSVNNKPTKMTIKDLYNSFSGTGNNNGDDKKITFNFLKNLKKKILLNKNYFKDINNSI